MKEKVVLLTGASGFIGKAIQKNLGDNNRIFGFRSIKYDLMNLNDCKKVLNDSNPDVVIHAAAWYGGIQFNKIHLAQMYYKNILMNTYLLEACREYAEKKKNLIVLAIGSACAYPGYKDGFLHESDLFDGPLNDSVLTYGFIKRALFIQGLSYHLQYGMRIIHPLLANVIGPGDTYEEERAHVVTALVKRFVEAKYKNESQVVIWGTGQAEREFIHVNDVVSGIEFLLDNYKDYKDPINLGTGIGTKISELTEIIKNVTRYSGKIVYDISKPDGTLKKTLNIDRIKKLGWRPKYTIEESIKEVVEDFINTHMKYRHRKNK